MKQKKTQIIFYFFLLIILSFSAHASETDSPGSFIGPDCPLEKFGESNASPDRVGLLPSLVAARPKCPRNPTRPPRTPDENCSAAQASCIDDCLRCISRNKSNAKICKSVKVCYAVCEANYRSCMGWL